MDKFGEYIDTFGTMYRSCTSKISLRRSSIGL